MQNPESEDLENENTKTTITTSTGESSAPDAFPQTDQPKVSIVIPVYNKWSYTAACLTSLLEVKGKYTFEVIVVDDQSSDESARHLSKIKGLTHLRNKKNLGFVGGCNRGARHARGEYIVFLNNDTRVLEGWLDELIDTFNREPLAGLVGSRLVYPDGSLQESGGIIFNDGSGWNYGRDQKAEDPKYHFLRESDYVSGACIALKTKYFHELGAFDERYAPAYYEDTDLAFRVRESGLKVFIQPQSVIIHYEGVTSGTDTSGGTKKYQLINQKTFVKRWKKALKLQPDPVMDPFNGPAIQYASQHRLKGRILFIDAATPEPDKDSGSVRLTNLMQCFRGLDYGVTFFADNRAYEGSYTRDLQKTGIEVQFNPWLTSLHEFFRKRGRDFDYIFVSRHYIAINYISMIKRYCHHARFIFDTVDLHYLREQRLAELQHSKTLKRTSMLTRRSELRVIKAADATLVVSNVEKEILNADAPGEKVHVLSNIHQVPGRDKDFANRKDIYFVGGYQHPPNIDAACWFVNDIWPLIHQQLPEMRFHLIGSNAPERVQALSGDGVVFHGFVESLEPFLSGCRLAVAPLRYGAGVKGKVNMSMAHGQPVVATPMAAEGMFATHGKELLIAEDAEAFAREVVRLYQDEELWNRLSKASVKNVEEHFSLAAARDSLTALFDSFEVEERENTDLEDKALENEVAETENIEDKNLENVDTETTVTTLIGESNAPDAFPQTDQPKVSIVIPVYNKWSYTAACLTSLLEVKGKYTFEVIVVDDQSSDESARHLSKIKGLTHLRNKKNLGFVGGCNRGARHARGEYIVFLNNDTRVLEGWLDELIDTFKREPLAGLVGSRLVYPDGSLQESGGIIFNDGSGWNYGRDQKAEDPKYHFLRESDYVSGACIALKTKYFHELGAFDERYAPAYYEDTDLAFRVRESGLKVFIQPQSVIIHYEGVTSGTDTSGGTKKYQLINQKTFVKRWKKALKLQPDPVMDPFNGPAIQYASQHRLKGRILFIDAATPEPDKDSGSVRLTNLMQCFRGLDYGVTFFADNRAYEGSYTRDLQKTGIEVQFNPWLTSLHEFFRKRGRDFDYIFVSRHYIAINYISMIKRYCHHARFIFDTVDLHYLREQRLAELQHSKTLKRTSMLTRRSELRVIKAADATLVVSNVEKEILNADAPGEKVHVLSNIHQVPGRDKDFANRKDIYFVGGYQHPPNIDAACWFVNDIWPLIHQQLPEMRFHLIGSNAPERVQALSGDGVVFHGFVESLEPFLSGCRLAVAPLRYGAGVKGKVNMSMAHGQPVVATPMAAEGMFATHGKELLIAEDAEAFAREVVRLYQDEELWNRLSKASVKNVEEHFSLAAARDSLTTLFESFRP